MSTRPSLSPPAAVAIWTVSLIGSWMMATAILGAINGAVVGCDSDSVTSAADNGGAGGWAILAVATLVPVLVMVAVAPAQLRGRMIGSAAAVAAVGLVAAGTWLGSCL